MRFVIAGFLFLVVTAVYGSQPDCTANRHLDECGAYCPVTTTVTTTLPPTIEGCNEGCIYPSECPDPKCPDVVCGSAGGAIVNVTVNKCPAVVFPLQQVCFIPRPHQQLKPHDKLVKRNGVWMVCPKRLHPQRVIAPIPS